MGSAVGGLTAVGGRTVFVLDLCIVCVELVYPVAVPVPCVPTGTVLYCTVLYCTVLYRPVPICIYYYNKVVITQQKAILLHHCSSLTIILVRPYDKQCRSIEALCCHRSMSWPRLFWFRGWSSLVGARRTCPGSNWQH